MSLVKRITLGIFGILISAIGTNAFGDLKIRGFADVIGSVSNASLTLPWINNYGRQVTLDSSRVGLNLAADLNENVDFAGQVVARGASEVGRQGDYIVSADWLFFNYRPNDHWRIRAGRQIFPLYLFSEQIDVGFTYLWTRLPTAVYGIVPVKSFNGASGAYIFDVGGFRSTFGIFAGTGFFGQVSPGIGGARLHDQYLKGANLILEADKIKLSASYKSSHPLGSVYAASPTGSEITVPIDLGDLKNYSVGVSTNFYHVITIAELGTSTSSLPDTNELTGFYGTLGYEFLSGGLIPHFTFAEQWSNSATSKFPDAVQVEKDPNGTHQKHMFQIVSGLTYRLSNSSVVKVEYEHSQLDYRNAQFNFGVDTFTLALDAVF